MQTHPNIGLVVADLLHLARFWLCIVFFPNQPTASISINHCVMTRMGN